MSLKHFGFFFIFAVIAAMILRPVDSWVSKRQWVQNLAQKYPSGKGAYAVSVGTAGAGLFVALLAAGFLLGLAGEGSAATPPTA